MSLRFTPEIALAHPLLADAAISPDGDVIAFVVASATRPSGPGRPAFAPAAIHAVPAAGGETRRLTYGRADTTPRWSPDGSRLAFLSDRERDGQREIHLLPRAGGEARQLTRLPSAIAVGRSFSPMAWFPDGRRLAIVMEEPKDAETAAREAAGNDQVVFEEEPRRWRLWAVDAESGAIEAISPPGLQIWEFAISPDGRRISAIASDEPYEWAWYLARLVVFDVGADQAYALATTIHKSWRQVAKPAWSPDGYEIAFLTSNWSDRGYDAGQPMIVSAAGGDARAVGDDEAVSDLNLWFHSDGRLLAAANVRGGSGISAIDAETGRRTWLWSGQRSFSTFSRATLADGGERFAAVIEDLEHPPEIHAGDLVDGAIEWRSLTSINAPWAQVARGETSEVTWNAPDGIAMQGFLFLPPGRSADDGPLPLVVLVHGGPAGAVRFEYQYGQRWARVLADAGLAVFAPNYRGSTGWGLAFAESNIGDMGGNDLDDILSGVDSLVAAGIADPDRLGICGWSYGGFMTAWVIGQTNRFRAAMAGAAIVDWHSFHGRSYLHTWDRLHYGGSDPYDPESNHSRFNPLPHLGKVTTPTLILHGELDWDVPVEQGYILHRALKDHGVETRLVVYPREPHGPSEYEHRLDILVRLRAWMVDHLAADPKA